MADELKERLEALPTSADRIAALDAAEQGSAAPATTTAAPTTAAPTTKKKKKKKKVTKKPAEKVGLGTPSPTDAMIATMRESQRISQDPVFIAKLEERIKAVQAAAAEQ